MIISFITPIPWTLILDPNPPPHTLSLPSHVQQIAPINCAYKTYKSKFNAMIETFFCLLVQLVDSYAPLTILLFHRLLPKNKKGKSYIAVAVSVPLDPTWKGWECGRGLFRTLASHKMKITLQTDVR